MNPNLQVSLLLCCSTLLTAMQAISVSCLVVGIVVLVILGKLGLNKELGRLQIVTCMRLDNFCHLLVVKRVRDVCD
jgi:hypothetical protein